jgi:hypothetical protein
VLARSRGYRNAMSSPDELDSEDVEDENDEDPEGSEQVKDLKVFPLAISSRSNSLFRPDIAISAGYHSRQRDPLNRSPRSATTSRQLADLRSRSLTPTSSFLP